jgi:hypothetical protein
MFLLFAFVSEIGYADDYEIIQVFKVGPCSGGTSIGPVKWSPDGTKISYFHESSLYISDTLGNNRKIRKLELPIQRYEWLSNYEIVIHLRDFTTKSGINKLIKLDINDSSVSVLEKYKRFFGGRYFSNPKSFNGPWKSAEGYLFYRTNVVHSTTKANARLYESEPAHLIKSSYAYESEAPPLNKLHTYIWGEDGIYKTCLDGRSKAKIGPKPYSHMMFSPMVNFDETFYIHGGTMYSFRDSMYIVLDTIDINPPENTAYCGIMYYSFNPQKSEVLFNILFCYDEEHEIYRMATFNYVSYEFKILDSEIGIIGCLHPSYSPDGTKISFISPEGIVHILYRKWK